MRTMNKTLSLLSAMCLVFALAPLSAFAGTGTMDINGTTVNLAQNATDAGGGWTWTASDSTLTVTGNISGDIIVKGTDSVTVTVSGTPTVTGKITCKAGLLINGSGTLTVKSSYTTIWTEKDLTIENVNVKTEVTAIGGCSIFVRGDFIMSSGSLSVTGVELERGIDVMDNMTIYGTANVTAVAVNQAIFASDHIAIGGTAVVSGSCDYFDGIYAGETITISDGSTVIAKGKITEEVTYCAGAITARDGITVKGGTLIVGDNADNGTVGGNLTIKNTANVTVKGGVMGNLTISGGTVTVDGMVEGTTHVTGGTVTLGGQTERESQPCNCGV